ncbi:site-specific DNA-methyltransferase [bacterium]|nr:site-specific DNA-methyltransferase [bacterium]
MSNMTAVKQRENNENVDRKDFTPSEAVTAWQEIEGKQGERTDLKELPSESDRGSPRDQATKLTGMSTDTLSKAKRAVIASRLANMPKHFHKTDRQICLSQPEAAGMLNISERTIRSVNLHRRHLNESQRAVIASRLANMTEGGDKRSNHYANLQSDKVSQSTAAKILNIMPVKQTDNRLIDKITLADNVDILPDIESDSIDLILTDPPYVTALADLYKSWNFKNHDFEFYALQFNRTLKDSGQVAMFCDYPTSLAIGNAFQKYFKFRYFYTWIKSNGQPVNKKQPRSNVELITVWKKQKTLTRDVTFNPVYRPGEPYRKFHKGGNITRKESKGYETINETGQRWPDQTLYYPSKDNLPEAERTGHPTQKSISLIGYLIRTLSNEGNLILDPFSGSGSVAITCHRLKRRFIAIEKDSDYYIESLGRLERERCQITLPF